MDNLIFSHGGNIYEIERKHKRNILDFSANINPLGLSNIIKTKLIKNLDTIRHYPDPYGRNLVKEIARYWKIKEENILLGNGSVEFIYLVMSCLKPKKVLIPVPTFSEYETASRLNNAGIQFVRLKEKDGFTLNIPRHIKTDMIFISNPNNPTGNLLIKNKKLNLPLAGKGFVVIDEAFMDFLPDEERHTLIHRAKRDRGIAVLRSFTKFFAIPGLRIGYLVAHKELVKNLRRYQIPWNVNTLAQLAAKEVLKDRGYIAKTRIFIERERDFLFNEIKKFKNLQPYSSVANFIFVKIKNNHVTSSSLKTCLIKKGILIRDCSNFRNLDSRFIRVAVRSRGENLKLLEGLGRIL